MNNVLKLVFPALLILLAATRVNAQRQEINISQSWKFGNSTLTTIKDPTFDDSSWELIDLPHTWNGLDGQDGGNNYASKANWYRRKFTPDNSWSEKKIFLRFGSANMQTDVYLNGTLIGSHLGGFGAFIFDLSESLNYGQENTLAVKVDNSPSIDAPPLSADFTFYGGITRKVELLITDKAFISPLDYASSGVYITPYEITDQNAKVAVKTLAGNHYASDKDLTITATLKDANKNIVASLSTQKTVTAGNIDEISLDLNLENPVRWDGMINPYLYQVEVSLRANGVETDLITQPLGIREYHVDAQTGFYLNGKSYDLHGVAMHEERADIGRAVSDANRREDMAIMHEMGCTFLRLAHYQHGQAAYNYCDSSGMVLWTEIPLINNVSSSTTFTDCAKTQLIELIKQNYNHPSVMFWGLFNEINFLSGPDPAPLVGELNTLAHSLDSVRLTTGAAMLDERATHWIPDVVSWNKYIGWYGGNIGDFDSWLEWMNTNHLDIIKGMSEYGAGADIADHVENPAFPNTNSYFHPEEYQNLYHETYWQAIESKPYIWSSALWVAFDFAADGRAEGPGPGINDKGLVTRDRQTKKDSYYYYKTNWTEDPFVYISSRRYTNRTDSVVEIKIYSNCEEVSLSINGVAYGTKTSTNHIFKWTGIKLMSTENVVHATGKSGENTYSDECKWLLNALINKVLPGEIQINFQPTSASLPEGHLIDAGDVFGNRGNGHSYGWQVDNSVNTRERTTSSDILFNTFNHMQKQSLNSVWEIALDNGDYLVSIACGDPDYEDSYHVLDVEGIEFLRGSHTANAMVERTDTVRVEDGRLTIVPGVESLNAKINLVHVTRLPGTDASLSDLTIDNNTIEGFDSDTLNYEVELPYDAVEVPAVVAFPSDNNATVKVIPAETLPGTTSIVVTSEDEATTKTYYIHFTVAVTLATMDLTPHITMFPNPAGNHLIIILSYNKSTIKILDLSGKIILTKSLVRGENLINVNGWRPGVYFIQTFEGKAISTERFFKK